MPRAGCPEEDQPQTNDGLGVVTDDEPIVYALIDPRTSKVGSIILFPKSDWNDRQLSVCRADSCDYDTFYDRAISGQVAKGSTYIGYVWATAGEIRKINAVDEKGVEQRVGALCVIDDSLPNYKSHARMGECKPDSKFWGRHKRLAARLQLEKVLLTRGIATVAAAPF